MIKSPYWKSALLLLFIVPFWTSYLTRTITWLPMFGLEGVVNQVLMALRITDEPLEFLLYSRFSMMVALWFLFIVFMIGPIYFSMQRIDEDVMSAAAVYGADPWRTFFQVVVPLTLPGLMAGSLFVVVLGSGRVLHRAGHRRRAEPDAGRARSSARSMSSSLPGQRRSPWR